MIYLKIIIFLFLAASLSGLFYQFRKSGILQTKFKEASNALDEASLVRARREKRKALIQQTEEKTFLEKLIEKPAKSFSYSGLGKKFPGLTVEIWLLLIIGSTALLYFVLLGIFKNFLTAAAGSAAYVGVIILYEKILVMRNYKAVDDNLIHFLNQLGNFSITSGEITTVFHQVSRYLPAPLNDALEECYYDAQTSGDASAALYALADKIEHEKFKEIINNIEICTNYTSNFKVVVDNCRKSLMEEQKAKRERKSMADEAVVNIFLLTILLGVALLLTNVLLEISIWNVLLHTIVGRCALCVVIACYLIFVWKIYTTERR